ncbi:MAG TPA: 30S ribosomal protein S16, partial [Patescibacteria group bacterium]|nr:30S ribosomal protein S16 [Patescibacteria group bacterium]
MLSIRMQRIGRKGHPVYRVVVQDSRQTPTSGKYVAMLGSYDPHTKKTTLVKEKAELYLKNGAQPSDRVVRLFASEKVAMPAWVKQPTEQKRDTRNPDKLRKNRPAEATPSEEQSVSDDNTEVVASTDKETTDTKPAEEAGSEEKNSAPEADESAGNTTAENLPPESAEEPAEDK